MGRYIVKHKKLLRNDHKKVKLKGLKGNADKMGLRTYAMKSKWGIKKMEGGKEVRGNGSRSVKKNLNKVIFSG